tara:strand:+ start:1563 stop:2225 length:663 start_codon:yes stop_codon:yes gene_type:complete
MAISITSQNRFPTFLIPSEAELWTLAQELVDMHEPDKRTYHAPAHPCNMFDVFVDHKAVIDLSNDSVDIIAIYWMFILHDVIIKVGTAHGWSERESAEFAYVLLIKLGYPQSFALFVKRGILATAKHSLDGIPEEEKPTVALLLDLDLMGLGQDAEGFAADTESIYLEYKHHYTREEYDEGRKKWAQSFRKPQRASVYHTQYFAHLEQQAQKNLTALAER